MDQKPNENDSLIVEFVGATNGILNEFLDEASERIINEGLSDQDAALLRIEKTIEASIKIRTQAEVLSAQVVDSLQNSSKTITYFNQTIVQLDAYVDLTPGRLDQVRAGLIDLDLAQARVLNGQALEALGMLTKVAEKGFFVLETLALADSLFAGDNRDAALTSVGTLIGLGIGALVLPVFSTVTLGGTIAAAIGAIAGIAATTTLQAVIGEDDYATFISTVSNLAEDLLIDQVRLDNGVELEVGNEILHQILINRIDNTTLPQAADEILQATSNEPERGAEQLVKELCSFLVYRANKKAVPLML